MDRIRALSLNAALVAAAFFVGLGCAEALHHLSRPIEPRIRGDIDPRYVDATFPSETRPDFSPGEKAAR